jgi:hypothetical protein
VHRYRRSAKAVAQCIDSFERVIETARATRQWLLLEATPAFIRGQSARPLASLQPMAAAALAHLIHAELECRLSFGPRSCGIGTTPRLHRARVVRPRCHALERNQGSLSQQCSGHSEDGEVP